MSDTETSVDIDEISADGDMSELWSKLEAAISSLDAEMDSWNPELGVKRAFLTDLVAENAEASTSQAQRLTDQLNSMDERRRFSLYAGFINTLNDALKKSFDAWVEAQVAELPKPEKVDIPEEKKKEVSKKRSEYYAMMKQLHGIATGFKMPFAKDWVLPKVRRASSGKRKPRALLSYDYWIDGEPLDGDDNSPLGVAQALGLTKSSEFTQALKDAKEVKDLETGKIVKINTSKPPTSFEVTLNGKLITAQRAEDEDAEDDTNDDEGEDDE